jgi:hypothetical protein
VLAHIEHGGNAGLRVIKMDAHKLWHLRAGNRDERARLIEDAAAIVPADIADGPEAHDGAITLHRRTLHMDGPTERRVRNGCDENIQACLGNGDGRRDGNAKKKQQEDGKQRSQPTHHVLQQLS